MISLSETVKYLRKQTGMTQAELAERCLVTRTTIVNVEKQNADPSLLLLQRIGMALGYELTFVAKDNAILDRTVELERQNAEYLAAIKQAQSEIKRVSKMLAEVTP